MLRHKQNLFLKFLFKLKYNNKIKTFLLHYTCSTYGNAKGQCKQTVAQEQVLSHRQPHPEVFFRAVSNMHSYMRIAARNFATLAEQLINIIFNII
jgi:hypothetical protein